jgi:hypothetical protein
VTFLLATSLVHAPGAIASVAGMAYLIFTFSSKVIV